VVLLKNIVAQAIVTQSSAPALYLRVLRTVALQEVPALFRQTGPAEEVRDTSAQGLIVVLSTVGVALVKM
jgi:hypothetical protein